MAFSRIKLFFILNLLVSIYSFSQENLTIFGRVTDSENYPVMLVNVSVKGTNIGSVTNKFGNYELTIPLKYSEIVFSFVGYKNEIYTIDPDRIIGNELQIDVMLFMAHEDIDEVSIRARYEASSSFMRIDAKQIETLPNTTGGIETIIKTLPGVSSVMN